MANYLTINFLDDDEMKKFYKEFMDEMDKQVVQPIVRPMSNLMTSHSSWGTSTGNLSPTDLDARYPYQEPEVDEQGTYYGYKVLNKRYPEPNWEVFVSPSYRIGWNEQGCLTADKLPSKYHMHGIHFTKRPDNPALREYYDLNPWGESSVLVKCALSGTIVETEQGFRAEHAQIIGVFENGHWTSYQDYKERSRTNSRRNPQAWEIRWNDYGKDIDFTVYNPSADS